MNTTSRVKDGNYVVIQSFMVKELSLKGNELLVYAIIYGFSQDGQKFSGSLQYLADWANCSKQTIISNLKSLCDKKLITKLEVEKNGIKFCEYQSNNFTGGQKTLIPSQISLPGGSQKSLMGGSQISLPNNISTNNLSKDNLEGRYSGKSRFTPPSLDDVRAYCQERHNSISPERFVDYYQSNGWMVGKSHMKDWKAAVRTWEGNQKKETNENPARKELAEGEIVKSGGITWIG